MGALGRISSSSEVSRPCPLTMRLSLRPRRVRFGDRFALRSATPHALWLALLRSSDTSSAHWTPRRHARQPWAQVSGFCGQRGAGQLTSPRPRSPRRRGLAWPAPGVIRTVLFGQHDGDDRLSLVAGPHTAMRATRGAVPSRLSSGTWTPKRTSRALPLCCRTAKHVPVAGRLVLAGGAGRDHDAALPGGPGARHRVADIRLAGDGGHVDQYAVVERVGAAGMCLGGRSRCLTLRPGSRRRAAAPLGPVAALSQAAASCAPGSGHDGASPTAGSRGNSL
jgi:hypothetical protein